MNRSVPPKIATPIADYSKAWANNQVNRLLRSSCNIAVVTVDEVRSNLHYRPSLRPLQLHKGSVNANLERKFPSQFRDFRNCLFNLLMQPIFCHCLQQAENIAPGPLLIHRKRSQKSLVRFVIRRRPVPSIP